MLDGLGCRKFRMRTVNPAAVTRKGAEAPGFNQDSRERVIGKQTDRRVLVSIRTVGVDIHGTWGASGLYG